MIDKNFELFINYFIQENMNNLIVNTATVLINKNGETTTLDVKQELRRVYPQENWSQSEISDTLAEWVEDNALYHYRDNGTYREYYKCSPTCTSTVSKPKKGYSVTLPDGTAITSSDRNIILSIAESLGYNLHYSQTKDAFEYINDMHPNHILNVIWQEIEGCNTPEKFVSYIRNSPYVNQLLNTL